MDVKFKSSYYAESLSPEDSYKSRQTLRIAKEKIINTPFTWNKRHNSRITL